MYKEKTQVIAAWWGPRRVFYEAVSEERVSAVLEALKRDGFVDSIQISATRYLGTIPRSIEGCAPAEVVDRYGITWRKFNGGEWVFWDEHERGVALGFKEPDDVQLERARKRVAEDDEELRRFYGGAPPVPQVAPEAP